MTTLEILCFLMGGIPVTPSFLLMETGDHLLLETGDKIIL